MNENDNLEDNLEETNLWCTEDELLDEVDFEFKNQIKVRGKDYYDNGHVLLCCKAKDGCKYYAKVKGHQIKPYIVQVEITEDDIIYSCTCPCEFHCKHEYAAFLAITNHNYDINDLKEEVKEKKIDFKQVLQTIPGEEIKEYLLTPNGMDSVSFEKDTFEDYFKKYYPLQEYRYYYNNLYNSLILDTEYEIITDSYLNIVNQYLTTNEFTEGLKIIMSIINAYNDANRLNSDNYILKQFPLIGMYLRVINRKGSEHIKKDLLAFMSGLEENHYYNCLYLEDIFACIKLMNKED